MTRALWLPDALRAEGVHVVEHPGWQTRGKPTFEPGGVICHHTAGPARGDAPSLRTCVDGRPDLPGPLAQIVLARSGTAIVIASGKANHAGAGGWRGITGNTHMFGIEAENTGNGEPWPRAQLDAYVRCCAAIVRRLGVSADRVCGHKEWATPPGRKVDPRGIDMPSFRLQVAARLHGTPKPDANAGRPWKTFAGQGTTNLDVYNAGGLDNQVSQVQILLGHPVTGRYERVDVEAVSALKRAAKWRDDFGRPETSSSVGGRFITALRALAGAT